MRSPLLCLLSLALVVTGCRTQSSAPPNVPTVTATSQQTVLPPRQPGAPLPQEGAFVTVRGQVRNPVVPWTVDLTLAQAIVLADYFGFGDPREIIVVRQGVSYSIDPRRLLKGLSNGLLEPGDIVVLR